MPSRLLAAALLMAICCLPAGVPVGRASLALAAAAASDPAAMPSQPTGIAVTLHWDGRSLGSLNSPGWGNLVLHDIRDGRAVGKKVIYDAGDAGYASISPDGRRLAFLKRNGAVAVISLAGGPARELTRIVDVQASEPDTLSANSPMIEWSSADGGEWIFFLPQVGGKGPTPVARVHALTAAVERVATIDEATRKVAFSTNASKTTGKLAYRPGAWGVPVKAFDASRPRGLAQAAGVGTACGPSVSPDGTFVVVNDNEHRACRIVLGTGGKMIHRIQINQWNTPADKAREVWQFFRWGVNSMDWILASQGGPNKGNLPYCDAVLFSPHHRRFIRITDNPPGQFDVACSFWEARGLPNLLLGVHVAEAPFTLRLTPDGGGDWRWDFGDGRIATGAAAEHTYERPGSHDVLARQHGRTLHGRVTVTPRQRPRLTSAVMLGPSVCLSFDEPVTWPEPPKTLKSGREIARLGVARGGQSVQLQLAAPLTAEDSLSLQGLRDQAQVPNAPELAEVVLRPEPWPSTTDGLIAVYDNLHRCLRGHSKLGDSFSTAQLVRDGLALVDRNGRILLSGGGASLEYGALLKGQTLTMEIGITPAGEQDAAICQLGSLVLRQVGRDLVIVAAGAGNAAAKPVGTVEAGKTLHLVISLAADAAGVYVDGGQAGREAIEPLRLTGRLPRSVQFAPAERGRDRWRGVVDGFALYSRGVDAAEAAARYRAWQSRNARRRVPAQVIVEAKLLETSFCPEPKDIAPYRDMLLVYEYELVRVVAGTMGQARPGDRIRVAHWGIVGRTKTAAGDLAKGQTLRLVLERWEDRPELHAEQISDSLDVTATPAMFHDASATLEPGR